MEPSPKSVNNIKIKWKERPLFIQNDNHKNSKDGDQNITDLRRACPQFIAVAVKNSLLFVCGIAMGFPTILIPALQENHDGRESSDTLVLNNDQISWLSSIKLIFIPLGCLFSGAFTRPIGKRRAMQIVNLPIIGSWVLFHFATRTEHLYAALCLAGLSSGLMEAPVLTYVAEITEPKYRGILSVLGSTGVISGVLVQFILGAFLDWRTIAAVNTIFPTISFVALFFIPESPTWLISNYKFEQAIRALQWLRGWVPRNQVEAEFNTFYDLLILKPSLEDANDGTSEKNKKSCYNRMKIFRKQTFWVPFMLIVFTFFVGHFSGKTPLQTYAVQIFHTLKVPINKFHATILLGVAEMISTILSAILIHFTGKRPLVLTSTIGCGLCFFGTATYAYFFNIVPLFAIDNAVVNASSIIPKNLLITANNITNIFEEKYETMPGIDKSTYMMNTFGYDITTLVPELLNTTLHPSVRNDEYQNKNKKEETLFEKEMDEDENNSFGKDVTRKNQVDSEKLLTMSEEYNNFAWLPLVLLLGSAFFAHLGIRMIPWILIGEVFPAAFRHTAAGLAGAVGFVFGFLANKLFIQMIATLSLPGIFWFYSSVAICGATVLFYVLPETENKTLAEIESFFSKKTISYDHAKSTFQNDVGKINSFEIPIDATIQKDPVLQQNLNSIGHSNHGFKVSDEKTKTTHV